MSTSGLRAHQIHSSHQQRPPAQATVTICQDVDGDQVIFIDRTRQTTSVLEESRSSSIDLKKSDVSKITLYSLLRKCLKRWFF